MIRTEDQRPATARAYVSTPRAGPAPTTPRPGKSMQAKLTAGWGTFDPILGTWREPPTNQRHWDNTRIAETVQQVRFTRETHPNVCCAQHF